MTGNLIRQRPQIVLQGQRRKRITTLSPPRYLLRISDSSFNAAKDKNTFPSTDERESISASATPPSSLHSTTLNSSSTISAPERTACPSQWAHLSLDLQKYLQYQQDSMTYYYYFFKLDNNDFLHTEFINLALENDLLLYAVVGFAAYHHTLKQPDGKLSHFLDYYNKAVSLLRSSLEQGRSRTPAIFLTILQLATFEECLGDWVNLSGHHLHASNHPPVRDKSADLCLVFTLRRY
jgi:Fungal specific transcription factor domain